MVNLTDNEKISAIRLKNEYLIGKIYGLYRSEFIHFFKQRLSKSEDAIFDIYQDAFLELCNKIHSNKLNESNLTSSLKTYLFGVGKFMLMAVNRKNHKQILELFSDVPDITDDEPGLGIENEKIVQNAVNQIGEPCHTLLVKQYWEDKSGEEIAIELSYKNADTVKNQKYRCIQKLKKELAHMIIY